MTTNTFNAVIETARRLCAGFVRGDRGAISPLMAMALIPVIGAMALAGEAGNWYLMKRNLQNAADGAALAAATNDDGNLATPGTTYITEARAVTAKYGLTHNGGNIDVAVTSKVACPSPLTTSDCYRVNITRKVPVYMLGALGFIGNTTNSAGKRAQAVTAMAIASPVGGGTGFCLIALGTDNDAIRFNGGGNASGCSFRSNGGTRCNGGGGAGSVYSYATAGNTNTCGMTQGTLPAASDPWSYLDGQMPADASNCTRAIADAHQGANAWTLGAADFKTVTQASDYTSTTTKCGDVKLTGNLPITNPNQFLSIARGGLILNGFTLSTSGSGSATVAFSGPSSANPAPTYTHFFSGSGTVHIAAPTSGMFSGVAIYQAPFNGARDNVDVSYAGNSPTLDIQGLIYTPNASWTLSGTVNFYNSALHCVALAAKSFRSNGGQDILLGNATSNCGQAGLNLPTVPGTGNRQALVQ